MPGSQINITLGTAGHIDHGKTALVKLLTGCDTDRLKEEKERGISIELGFAPCTVGDLEIGIVDVPGHENFIKTMVAGASGMDAVMLVVAADDGVMPQTREHMEILTLLGVRHGFVALTKIDRVEPEHRELVGEETRAFLQGTFLAARPHLPHLEYHGRRVRRFLLHVDRPARLPAAETARRHLSPARRSRVFGPRVRNGGGRSSRLRIDRPGRGAGAAARRCAQHAFARSKSMADRATS